MTPAPWDAPAGETGLTWTELRDSWLASQPSNTARAYRSALRAFFATMDGAGPAGVRARDVIRWRNQLRDAGRKPATVRARIAALSSWFAWCGQPQGADGEVARADNPAARVPCGKVEAFGRSRPTTEAAFRRMLAVATLRTRAWLLAHVLTGRRRAEIARLTLGDLVRRGNGIWYGYRGKGKAEAKWRELPGAVVDAIVAWRGSLEGPPEERLWGASEGTLARELKRTAARAGLEVKEVHVHGLRHLAALLRREDGDDVGAVSKFLDHANPAITAVYLQALEVQRDSRADSIARRLLDG